MVIFLSSAQSAYFNQYFCLMCIYQLFWFWTISNHRL